MLVPVVIHKEEGSAYGVTVPDIPGCYGASDHSVEDALRNTSESIEFHIEGLMQDPESELPSIGSIDDHIDNKDYSDAFMWASVNFDVNKLIANKARRFNLSMKELVLAKVDRRAHQLGMDRSEYFAFAAIEEMTKKASDSLAK